MHTPVRRALLIKGPGGSAELDQGGECDIQNMRRLLLSAVGGSWMRQEICILRNPSASRVAREVKGTVADYSVTYFTGHGCAYGDNSWLQINGCEPISELCLINDSPRQLIVGDHCRERLPASIGGIPKEMPLFQTADWWRARQVLDQEIMASPSGISFAWAASLGQLAWGNSSGGAFTLELLELVHRWCGVEPLSPIYLESLIAYADKGLGKRGREQNPEYLAYRGALRVPFALTTALPAATAWHSPDPNGGNKLFEPFPGLAQNPSLRKADNGKALALVLGTMGALWLLGRER
jgi:Caspase domain